MPYKPHIHNLSDGGRLRIRQIEPGDKAALASGLEQLSPRSRYLRFFSALQKFSRKQLAYLTEVDHVNHEAWVALELAGSRELGIGVARYIRLPEQSNIAEAAVTVVDAAQGRGVGLLLLGHLARSARLNGIDTFRSYVLPDNEVMLRMLHQLGCNSFDQDGMRVLDLHLPEDLRDFPDTPLGRMFKAVARERWEEG